MPTNIRMLLVYQVVASCKTVQQLYTCKDWASNLKFEYNDLKQVCDRINIEIAVLMVRKEIDDICTKGVFNEPT